MRTGTIVDLFDYIISMLHDFRYDIKHTFVKTTLSIFKKMKVVENMTKILECYLKQKFLCNILLKERYEKKTKKLLKRFFTGDLDRRYFFKLTDSEIYNYESSSITRETNNIISILENDIDTRLNISGIEETTSETEREFTTDTTSETEPLLSTPQPPTVNTMTFRRRRSSYYLPPIVANTYRNTAQRELDNNINEILNNRNPFQPRNEILRSPQNRDNRHVGLNATTDINRRLSFGF